MNLTLNAPLDRSLLDNIPHVPNTHLLWYIEYLGTFLSLKWLLIQEKLAEFLVSIQHSFSIIWDTV